MCTCVCGRHSLFVFGRPSPATTEASEAAPAAEGDAAADPPVDAPPAVPDNMDVD